MKPVGKPCNKLIVFTFPMSMIYQILQEVLYRNSKDCHSHLYNQRDIWNNFPKLCLKYNC